MAFDLEVFGRVVDDYEAIHTIRGDIERDLARPVETREIAAALLRLIARDLPGRRRARSINPRLRPCSPDYSVLGWKCHGRNASHL
jgi:hypothetical protein